MLTPGEWPLVTSQAEERNNYVYRTLEQAECGETSRASNQNDEPCYRLIGLLKSHGLISSGRRAALVARLTAHEATLLTPPSVAVTEAVDILEFLKFPTEIRVMVYTELLTLKEIDFAHRDPISNILRVNKQIYNEAKGFLYSLNTIEIKLDDWDSLWLRDSYRPFYVNDTRKQVFAPSAKMLNLPSYIQRCQKIKVVLSIRSLRWHCIRPQDMDTLLINFKSLVYTELMDHEHLRDIQFELQFTGDPDHYVTSTVTDEQMRSFEQGCLDTFCHLRGMHAVSLEGFTFVDPFNVFLAKRTVTLPSTRTLNSFATIPTIIEAAPQWWQLKSLSKRQNCLLR